MKNTIKRLTDSKYLVSAEADTWTADIAEATKFTEGRTIVARIKLCTKYLITDIVVEPVVETPPTETPNTNPTT